MWHWFSIVLNTLLLCQAQQCMASENSKSVILHLHNLTKYRIDIDGTRAMATNTKFMASFPNTSVTIQLMKATRAPFPEQ